MVLEVEGGLAAVAIFHILPPAGVEHGTVLLRGKVGTLLEACGTVAGKGEYVGLVLHHGVDNLRHLVGVHTRHSGHHRHSDASAVQHGYLLECDVERAMLAHIVVRRAVAIDAELILLTAITFQTSAVLVGQMERVAEDGERNRLLFDVGEDIPDVWMQKGIASRDVEVREAIDHAAAHV